MEELLLQLGYLGMFLASLIAATIVPFASGALLAAMSLVGYNIGLLILCGLAGSYIGRLINYFIGKKGSAFIFSRWIKIDPQKWERAEGWFNRWGPPILYLSFLPIFGDPLTFVAGAFSVRIPVFTVYTMLGSLTQYLVLIAIARGIF